MMTDGTRAGPTASRSANVEGSGTLFGGKVEGSAFVPLGGAYNSDTHELAAFVKIQGQATGAFGGGVSSEREHTNLAGAWSYDRDSGTLKARPGCQE